MFKIQANMDPRHRDRVAFVRVCSGRFTKDMVLSNSRMGKVLRASRAYRFFGRDRETINVAYAGDVIGLVNPGQFAIGDTLHSGAPVRLPEVPRFPAEHFGRVRLQDTRYKQFAEGLRQLEEEGLMQLFYVTAGGREPIVGVVGALQFDVIVSRLRTEYAVEVEIEPTGVHRGSMDRDVPPRRSRRRRHRARSSPTDMDDPWCCSVLRGSCSTSSASIPTCRCSQSRRCSRVYLFWHRWHQQLGSRYVDASRDAGSSSATSRLA